MQFRSPGLVQVVVGALAASGLAPERLELEITESTLLQDSEATLNTLYQLRALGVRIAMDDFGTGYSSLSYLQSFPFDKIKIDRSFVKDIADGVGSLNIVRAVAAMAKGLGMTTTAEGVETREQLDTVRAEGCTEMQGFLFSRPMPASEVEPFLRQCAGETALQPARRARWTPPDAECRRSGLLGILEDHRRPLLADHDRGRVGVAADHLRHDGSVHHPEAADAVHPSRGSTTASGPCPMRQVPTGWRLETPRLRRSASSASSVVTAGPGCTSSPT